MLSPVFSAEYYAFFLHHQFSILERRPRPEPEAGRENIDILHQKEQVRAGNSLVPLAVSAQLSRCRTSITACYAKMGHLWSPLDNGATGIELAPPTP